MWVQPFLQTPRVLTQNPGVPGHEVVGPGADRTLEPNPGAGPHRRLPPVRL
ncbi:hypothetical protein IscW_ISCW018569 [Ixodes scapularis]|uniref:Uncharacterized protein n=1 Tax=Ixodes scapularis TaxID=6945 RepID=B7PQW4_IXOSC|nr:hypothetical protein IscW_ISCW018569 [Ixodes scapularis]|eukprot:XP_002436156.1 hypothetical protein IscW_ISCW018569 [Ixodes scapularis]